MTDSNSPSVQDSAKTAFEVDPRNLLPGEAWQHPEHGQRWHRLGRCATCGDEKAHAEYFHCDACYERLWPTLIDYDDD